MAESNKTPITEKTWQELRPGEDGIQDSRGRVWHVSRRDPKDKNRLFAIVEGRTEQLDWSNGEILDEEWALITALNNPDVLIVKV